MYAKLGFKGPEDPVPNYTPGWTSELPDNAWTTISLDEPSPGAFADLDAVSILFGAYYADCNVYVDWVRGIKTLPDVPDSLWVDPGRLTFYATEDQSAPLVDTLDITSNAMTYFFWQLSESIPWLSADKTDGLTPDKVEVAVSAAGLAAGVYSGVVRVDCPEAENSPRYVRVSLHVEPSVEVDSAVTQAGEAGTLPIYISHDSLQGLFIPLRYTASGLTKDRDITDLIRIDSLVIDPWYRDHYDINGIIDEAEGTIIVEAPIQPPPILPPDTNQVALLATVHFTTLAAAAGQVIVFDTTRVMCDGWNGQPDSCHLQYVQWDGSTVIPNFYPGAIVVPGCCVGMRGNVDEDAAQEIDIVDLTMMVNYMYKDGPEPSCMSQMNVNASGEQPTVIDIVDLVYLVNYMFKYGPEPKPCY